jgi:hypothetical protein
MKAINLTVPDFFLCEQPIKDGSNLDQRMWIYSKLSLSLIEVLPEDEITTAVDKSLIQKRFIYINSDGIKESFLLIFVQNNCAAVDADPINLLQKAWEWFEDYLKWEDGNIDSQSYVQNN